MNESPPPAFSYQGQRLLTVFLNSVDKSFLIHRGRKRAWCGRAISATRATSVHRCTQPVRTTQQRVQFVVPLFASLRSCVEKASRYVLMWLFLFVIFHIYGSKDVRVQLKGLDSGDVSIWEQEAARKEFQFVLSLPRSDLIFLLLRDFHVIIHVDGCRFINSSSVTSLPHVEKQM